MHEMWGTIATQTLFGKLVFLVSHMVQVNLCDILSDS